MTSQLLTLENPKAKKGLQFNYLTALLHLAPSIRSGYNVCQHASPGCIRACLNTAGRGGMFKAGSETNQIQEARIRRTKMFFEEPDWFFDLLVGELRAAAYKAMKKGLKLAIRLNATSDLPWERIQDHRDGLTIFQKLPQFTFYDYTKVPGRVTPANYHLTFSRSEVNEREAKAELVRGRNVAVVFEDRFPEEFWGAPVIDGEQHDLRFLDPQGVIVGLKAKGKARKDESGFVLQAA